MRVRALRRFAYAADGIEVAVIDPGTTFDCRDDLVAGLLAEGYAERIMPEPASEAAAPVAETKPILRGKRGPASP